MTDATRAQIEFLRYLAGQDGRVPLRRAVIAGYAMRDAGACARHGWLDFDDERNLITLTDLGREILEHPVSGPEVP